MCDDARARATCRSCNGPGVSTSTRNTCDISILFPKTFHQRALCSKQVGGGRRHQRPPTCWKGITNASGQDETFMPRENSSNECIIHIDIVINFASCSCRNNWRIFYCYTIYIIFANILAFFQRITAFIVNISEWILFIFIIYSTGCMGPKWMPFSKKKSYYHKSRFIQKKIQKSQKLLLPSNYRSQFLYTCMHNWLLHIHLRLNEITWLSQSTFFLLKQE